MCFYYYFNLFWSASKVKAQLCSLSLDASSPIVLSALSVQSYEIQRCPSLFSCAPSNVEHKLAWKKDIWDGGVEKCYILLLISLSSLDHVILTAFEFSSQGQCLISTPEVYVQSGRTFLRDSLPASEINMFGKSTQVCPLGPEWRQTVSQCRKIEYLKLITGMCLVSFLILNQHHSCCMLYEVEKVTCENCLIWLA